LDGFVFSYISLILSGLEYASVAWNNVTLVDSKEVEKENKHFARRWLSSGMLRRVVSLN
jgi:hypothetical protein